MKGTEIGDVWISKRLSYQWPEIYQKAIIITKYDKFNNIIYYKWLDGYSGDGGSICELYDTFKHYHRLPYSSELKDINEYIIREIIE